MRNGLLSALALTVGLAAGSATPSAACPWHKSLATLGFWAPVPLLAASDPLLAGRSGRATAVPVGDPPAEVGRWLPPAPWEVIAIHAAMLPTGKVLYWSYPDGTPGSKAQLWDPRTGTFTSTTIDEDIFCAGQSFLSDGRILATGGHDYACLYQGREVVYTFHPGTGEWTEQPSMSVGRWYPTNVALGSGQTMILSGLGRDCVTTPVMEVFTRGGDLRVVPEGERYLALYPRMHLLTSGKVAHVGPESSTYTFDIAARRWEFVDFTVNGSRYDGVSAHVAGDLDEILACGGSDAEVSASCERIDLGAPNPAWRSTAAMHFARAHHNVVALPDGKLLVVGGGADGLYSSPVLNAELYDPEAESWTVLPPQVHGRMYHSTTVLLPDGRVVSAGQDSGDSSYTGEIYEPPYLFRGPRPVITGTPRVLRYGRSFAIDTPDAAAIERVVLIGLTTVTHSVNSGQRYVPLAFTAGGGRLLATAPPSGNHAPPGPYMLFVLDGDGVPSEARIVKVAS